MRKTGPLDDPPSRTCQACGHVHPYETPIYRCRACLRWGQDFYELPPPTGMHRGHPMVMIGGAWLYADTMTPVAEDPDRACGHCRRPNRADGHDACLGCIPLAVNACCGHGDDSEIYIQWPLGIRVGGCLARLLMPRQD